MKMKADSIQGKRKLQFHYFAHLPISATQMLPLAVMLRPVMFLLTPELTQTVG